MESIRELYKIGRGPSSSHTIGPERICQDVLVRFPGDYYEVILYGSLNLTGRGHLTDQIITDVLKNVTIHYSDDSAIEHPNTMDVLTYQANELIHRNRYYSIGGGSIRRQGDETMIPVQIYPHRTFEEIKTYCLEHRISLYQYVFLFEDSDFRYYLRSVWKTMQDAINTGLHTEGFLPGELKVRRKAKSLLYNHQANVSIELRLVSAYAYAVSEVNASAGTVVTAPTCGASGVLPSVLYYLKDVYKYNDDRILDALATAGLIGNIVKHNGSISGAEAGCQAEVGTACSMAAAAYAELQSGHIPDIEYAAEIALEHHLGLTCDPVKGFVQIPCIERNAVAAHRAINAGELAQLLTSTSLISFDTIVETMKETGHDLQSNYKETSLGGLAKKYKKKDSIE